MAPGTKQGLSREGTRPPTTSSRSARSPVFLGNRQQRTPTKTPGTNFGSRGSWVRIPPPRLSFRRFGLSTAGPRRAAPAGPRVARRWPVASHHRDQGPRPEASPPGARGDRTRSRGRPPARDSAHSDGQAGSFHQRADGASALSGFGAVNREDAVKVVDLVLQQVLPHSLRPRGAAASL